ncbi:hypothetical protein O6H91_09G044900 [Diphasiastrum complanatum]|uniref:Uncharacterized protein n=1 Tax=Diphasiastrum complanatum TaxID=34168 RepID=A0ACC2CNL5_DIPCM|nr:hypothetical protein O6H91_09G044900 [Diphasiastrum complanatum]
MKADMALDYALFQLDSTRTRCELWISAGGVTEKLASGLLKPFLDHLRAAQEQISSGAQSIRLQAPSVTANGRNSGAAWFSKGTMERFVRFVSIPEVLERVSAVEAECQRLEEAINILASESGDDHHLFDTTSVPVQPGIKPVDGKNAAKTGESRKLKQDYHDIPDTTGDTSKQLLRAMDGRRAMLQKEQRKALAQAVAAGFNMECMSNLVVFADCFGAIQLREACAKFMALRKKIQEFGSLIDEMELAAETVSTGLKMNRSGIVLLDSENSGAAMPATGFLDKPFENQRDSGGYFDDTHEKLVISSTDNQSHDKLGESGDRIIKGRTSASKIGSSRVPDAFKRQLGMPHLHPNVRDHVMKLSVDKLEYGMDRVENIECRQMGIKTDIPDGEDCRSLGATDNCFSSSGVPANFSLPEIKTADSLCDTCIVPEKDLPSDEETNCSTDNDTRRSARRSSSPTRRSVSPHRKVQIGRPPVRRQGVVVMKTFSHLSSNSQEAGYTKHTDDKGSEDSESDKDTESKINCDEEKRDSKSEHRRLSVQDAINLFERKKKESVELPLPKVSGCDGQRDILETGKRLAPVKDVLRRWNVAGDPGPESATKPSKTDSTRENLEVDLSAKHVKPNNHDNGDTGNRPDATDVGKSEKLPSVEAAINGDGLPAEHDMEQKQLSVKPRTMQFDSAPSSQQLLQNSKLQAFHAISVPPEHEKQNIRRWSLPTPPFHSTFNTEPVKLDSHSDVVKDSSLDNGQALKQTVVKGVVGPSDKELRVEQKKPKHYPSAELGLNGNSTVHRQASTVEDAGLDKPQELSWKGTNILKRPNQQEVKERLKGAGYQIEQSPTMSASDDLSEKSTSKGTVRRSWSTPSDFHLEALAKMVDNKDNEDDDHELTSGGGNPKDLKGIFYEQYRQKRDAKLRQESGFKRAEREAKMKAMQEAFERSKEELTARSNRFSENNTAYIEDSGRMGRIQFLKAGPLKSKRESLSTPILQDSQSASSTRIGKHVNSRQNTARKISPSAQKSSSSATAAPGTTRAAGSPSQKSIPKNSSPSGARSSQRRGSSGSPAKTFENMLKSSAPSSAELQKELTKPSLGHRVHSSHQEKGSTLRGLPYKDAERAFNLMGVALPDSLGQMSESMREIQKSISSSDEIEQDGIISPSGFSAKDRLAEPASEAGKIFLQENDEFRPESQPDKVIMKSSFVPDAVKINYEEDFSSSSSNMAPFESEEPDSISPGEDEETSSIAEQLSATKETIHPLDIANEEASSFYLGDHNVSASGQDGSKVPQDEALSTSQMSQKFLASLDNQDSHLRVPISNFVEPGKPPLPSLFALHSKEMFQNSKMSSYNINVARSFSSPPKDSQLPGILNAEDRDSFLGSVPVSSFHTTQLPLKLSENHHDSPTVSSIKFDQIQSRKTWNNSQKAVSLNSQHIQKESSKGFKRLLKFGRRSRGSEPTTQDWIAASTSEGDEDGDESKDYFGEDDFRASGNDSRNAYKHTERISKVTDIDGVNGTGPRSFFSLSSFRSKSSESRSRA